MLTNCRPRVVPIIKHLVVNYCIDTCSFPRLWKRSLITPLPKVNTPSAINDLRTVSILYGYEQNEEKFSTEYRKVHSRTFTYLSVHITTRNDTRIYISTRPNEALGSVDKQNGECLEASHSHLNPNKSQNV